jgi:hypothetical protein
MIKIFGIWLVLANVNYMTDVRSNCLIWFNGAHKTIEDVSCELVTKAIKLELEKTGGCYAK